MGPPTEFESRQIGQGATGGNGGGGYPVPTGGGESVKVSPVSPEGVLDRTHTRAMSREERRASATPAREAPPAGRPATCAAALATA